MEDKRWSLPINSDGDPYLWQGQIFACKHSLGGMPQGTNRMRPLDVGLRSEASFSTLIYYRPFQFVWFYTHSNVLEFGPWRAKSLNDVLHLEAENQWSNKIHKRQRGIIGSNQSKNFCEIPHSSYIFDTPSLIIKFI